MKTLAAAAAVLSLLAVPLAEASPKNGRGNGNGNGNGNGGNGAWATGTHCPPGLANRDPACVPPGQARRGDDGETPDQREIAEDRAEEAIVLAEDDDGRDGEQALAIVGTLLGLAMIERARREAEAEAAAAAPVAAAPAAPVPTAPVAAAPAPSFFSFSEVPSRPASIETLATASLLGDAADPGFVADAAEPEPEPEPAAAPSARLVPLSPVPAPVPTPEEEAQLTDVFRRAAGEGATGF